MTEIQYLLALKALWPRAEGEMTSPAAMALVHAAVEAFPHSARLWVVRGDLIQLGPHDDAYPLTEALRCYERAMAIDPGSAEAWESAAHFHDAVLGDEQAAAPYVRECARLRGR